MSTSTSINPFDVPIGQAINLPSVRQEDTAEDEKRKVHGTVYGGKGDKKHLGGFTEIDMQGISPAVWKHVVEKWTVQSVLDVGCGRGTSTSWFYTHGLRTQCVEGSHDAIEQSMLPDKSLIVEHDFSRGPWWPKDTFDAVWSVEFLEHVNVQFHYNYISTFRKAAILLVTSSRWGGWHHVEVHSDDWWIRKYEAYGFKYDDKLTQELKHIGAKEKANHTLFPPNDEEYNAQHVWTSMKVFINPTVAALPQHAHLFGEFGCFEAIGTSRECGTKAGRYSIENAEKETLLDPSFYPLNLTITQDEAWYDIVKANIKQKPKKWDVTTELLLREREKKNIDNYQLED
ncbi:hypothetical protein FRACYDRAFT_178829 [Fragilariopsis cylindrus CCMP1102]|uniref:Uncharacterized protein n=1 Tax=Fragilariopsis cylindrus CCMP1102 TaxID=635003 RepID=A0A1E7FUB1_9STRA|nr:hypothetical protein FRACYDRAFT_178829 [Fragilariopsis cylindrus CCMP1102]|eukprot:OEU21738.1 hypothetical protein FRACYDRAFT_178829 [Fragilariopsis cylindrus CCMP1102]